MNKIIPEINVTGNVAVMRAALLIVLDDMRKVCKVDRDAVAKICKDALSAPPRNCDIFKSEDEAKSAFIAYYNEAFDLKGSKDKIDYCDLKHDVDGILHDYIEWLFAPAKTEARHE